MSTPATGSPADLFRELFDKVNVLQGASTRQDAELRALTEGQERIEQSIERLGGRINRGTDWGLLAAWMGVALTIGKTALDPVSSRIEKLEKAEEKRQAMVETVSQLEERSRWQAKITGVDLP